jgi:uncharacterized protein DUF3152
VAKHAARAGGRRARPKPPLLRRVRPPGLAVAATSVLVLSGVGGSTTGAVGLHTSDSVPREAPQAEAPAEMVESSQLSPMLSVPRTAVQERTARLTRPAPGRRRAADQKVNGRMQPEVVQVPDAASGRYDVVPGEADAAGRGPVVRYLVEMERGLPFSGRQFAAEVHRILNDERGWGRAGRIRFVRVDSGEVRFRVSLSSPDLTDEQCAPLRTLGQVSCFARGRAVINARRWGTGSPTYGNDIASYREYLISHEVGHGLGHGHESCPRPEALAPVMVQQTKSLEGCRPNPWPYP